MEVIPEFLIDEYEKFKCDYTIWVYIELKFKYQYYLQKSPYKTFKIDVKSLAAKYVTTTATIYNAIKELTEAGLLVENKRNFRIVDESEYSKRFKNINPENNKKYPKYVILNNKAYNDLLSDIKDEVLPMESHKKFIVKCLKLYYYQMIYDRHCVVFKEEPVLESSLTQTSIEKKIGIDHRNVKKLLTVLNDSGYIKLEDGKIFTLNKETYDPAKYSFLKSVAKQEETRVKHKNAKVPIPNTEPKKVPGSFIGYMKSEDGGRISVIYYSEKLHSVVIKGWCKGDGIPRTPDEYEIGSDLISSGRQSKYHNPAEYWKYNPINKEIENRLMKGLA